MKNENSTMAKLKDICRVIKDDTPLLNTPDIGIPPNCDFMGFKK